MNVELIARPPAAQCYECQGNDVTRLCHHCGRGICRSHAAKDRQLHGAGPVVATTKLVRSREFSYLQAEHLEKEGDVTHCGDCAHAVNTHRPARILGALVFLLGAALLAVVLVAGLAPTALDPAYLDLIYFAPVYVGAAPIGPQELAAGGALLALASGASLLAATVACRRSLARNRPPLALVGKIDRLAVEETIDGTILLDAQGQCTAKLGSPTGKLVIDAECTLHDRECLRLYRKRFHTRGGGVPYHGGFYVLPGDLPIQWRTGDAVQPNTIAVRGDVGSVPFLTAAGDEPGPRGSSHLQYAYAYSLLEGAQAARPVVQVLPFVPPEGDQQILEIYVRGQLPAGAAAGHAGLPLELAELVLAMPQSLGDIVRTDPPALASTGGAQQELLWQGAGRKDAGAQEHCFRVYFRLKIPHDASFTGHVHFTAAGALSGIGAVQGYYPWGAARQVPAPELCTRLRADFTLQLPPLLFQEAVTREREKTSDCAGDIDGLVIAFAKNLGANGLYVKRMVENRPQTSHTDAHFTNRYWDISGCSVDRLCPMPFHIVISGEQARARTARSKLHYQITVQGPATSDATAAAIGQLCDTISGCFDDTISQYSAQYSAQPAPAGGPESGLESGPAGIPAGAPPAVLAGARAGHGPRAAVFRRRDRARAGAAAAP